jgi:transcriptional regulator with XRE-family HTH domain
MIMNKHDEISQTQEQPARKTNSVDIIVGQRLKLRRVSLKMSQDELSRSVGISFQQLQKYENGQNRVSAGRLFDFARALGVPVGWFFDLSDRLATLAPDGDADIDTARPAADQSTIISPEVADLQEVVGLYFSIDDPDKRRQFMRAMRFMASELKANRSAASDL